MKRIFLVGVLTVMAGLSMRAAQKNLRGEISDSMCGANHAEMGDMGKNPGKCTAACVKTGAQYVFVSKGKVYAIRNQDFSALAANTGASVQVQADVDEDGKTMRIATLERVGN